MESTVATSASTAWMSRKSRPDESGIVLDVSLPPDELVARAVRGLGLPAAQPAT